VNARVIIIAETIDEERERERERERDALSLSLSSFSRLLPERKRE
jgi:hypothetical protein